MFGFDFFLMTLIIIIAIFMLSSFGVSIEKSKDIGDVMSSASSIFGPILTGLITIWVLHKNLKQTESLQNKMIEREEINCLYNKRSVFEVSFSYDDYKLSNSFKYLYPGVLVVNEISNSVLFDSIESEIVKGLRSEKFYYYMYIKNSGSQDMYNVEICINGAKYYHEGKKVSSKKIEYNCEYIKSGNTIVLQLFMINKNKIIKVESLREVEITYSTALCGSGERITTNVETAKDSKITRKTIVNADRFENVEYETITYLNNPMKLPITKEGVN